MQDAAKFYFYKTPDMDYLAVRVYREDNANGNDEPIIFRYFSVIGHKNSETL